jgi:hypothetical protein
MAREKKPKPPETSGGAPLPLFPALRGKTWYHGGISLIVAFVPEDERESFTDAANAAGYHVEAAETLRLGGSVRVRFSLRRVAGDE